MVNKKGCFEYVFASIRSRLSKIKILGSHVVAFLELWPNSQGAIQYVRIRLATEQLSGNEVIVYLGYAPRKTNLKSMNHNRSGS